jgi:hypothetical protein
MSLPPVLLRGSPTQLPSCDHIRAHMPNTWQRGSAVDTCRTRDSFVIGSYSHFGIGIEFASSSIERGGSHWPGTDSAANQFGAHVTERTKPRAAHFRCLWPVSAPRAFV